MGGWVVWWWVVVVVVVVGGRRPSTDYSSNIGTVCIDCKYCCTRNVPIIIVKRKQLQTTVCTIICMVHFSAKKVSIHFSIYACHPYSRGQANLLCIVPIFTDDDFRHSVRLYGTHLYKHSLNNTSIVPMYIWSLSAEYEPVDPGSSVGAS